VISSPAEIHGSDGSHEGCYGGAPAQATAQFALSRCANSEAAKTMSATSPNAIHSERCTRYWSAVVVAAFNTRVAREEGFWRS
jgi:hypothetical protein